MFRYKRSKQSNVIQAYCAEDYCVKEVKQLKATKQEAYCAAGLLLVRNIKREEHPYYASYHPSDGAEIVTQGLFIIEPNKKLLSAKSNCKGKALFDINYSKMHLNIPGGKRDDKDADAMATAIREFDEETGGIIGKEYLTKLVTTNMDNCFWIHKAKYILIVCFIKSNIKSPIPDDFKRLHYLPFVYDCKLKDDLNRASSRHLVWWCFEHFKSVILDPKEAIQEAMSGIELTVPTENKKEDI